MRIRLCLPARSSLSLSLSLLISTNLHVIWRDDADLRRADSRIAAVPEPLDVLENNADLIRVEERRAISLTHVLSLDAVKDDREALEPACSWQVLPSRQLLPLNFVCIDKQLVVIEQLIGHREDRRV